MKANLFNKPTKIVLFLAILVSGFMGISSYNIRNKGNITQQQLNQNDIDNQNRSFDQLALSEIFSQTMAGYYELKKAQDPSLEAYDIFIGGKEEEAKDNEELRESINNYYNSAVLNPSSSGIYSRYLIQDNTTKKNINNDTSQSLISLLENPTAETNLRWYIMFSFDKNGVMSVPSYQFLSETYTNASSGSATINYGNGYSQNIMEYYNEQLVLSSGYSLRNSLGEASTNLVKDATYIFAIDNNVINTHTNYNNFTYDVYSSTARTFYNFILIAFAIALTFFKISAKDLPWYPLIRKLPYEGHLMIVIFIICVFYCSYGVFFDLATTLVSATTLYSLTKLGIATLYLAYLFLLLKESYLEKTWKPYFISRKVSSYITGVDLTKKDNLRVLVFIIINYFLIFIFISMDDFGLFLAAFYFIVIFFIAMHYLTKTRKEYQKLLDVTKDISSGQFNNDIAENLGVFNDFKKDIIEIQANFKHAVEEEVHSQKMKTELISNVSHDLKTPLTSIITYTDLLKKEGLSEKDRKKYLNTLDRNSIRLKHLIEDLFEVSKANSGNIKLEKIEIDICSLMLQIQVELADKFEKAKLDIRNQFANEKILCVMDPQKTYRIFENLLINITKYAMPNTRVYITIDESDSNIELSLKNISATELNFKEEDITERFMRGDKSRNTEGSGLGLAIAKTFSELHNGKLDIYIDGDLFKVILNFPKK